MACCIIFACHNWRERDFFALSARFIKWAVESEHMVVCWLVALIACWIVLTICIYIEGGAV